MMKLLLDENLPIKLKYRFIDHGFDSYTVKDMAWLGKKNGELLNLMPEQKFTTFITIEKNLSFQNNFKSYPIQVLVIIARDNTYPTIMDIFDNIVKFSADDFSGVQTVIHPDY